MSATLNRLKVLGHEKIAGENSLTAGEMFFTIAAAVVIYYGVFMEGSKLTRKQAVMLGIALLVFGETVF